ncbi:MAG TPA: hypothetical protein PLD68_00340 [Clostridiales bacterium]|nr:hypothetical protein [Clostridiales bacterium]
MTECFTPAKPALHYCLEKRAFSNDVCPAGQMMFASQMMHASHMMCAAAHQRANVASLAARGQHHFGRAETSCLHSKHIIAFLFTLKSAFSNDVCPDRQMMHAAHMMRASHMMRAAAHQRANVASLAACGRHHFGIAETSRLHSKHIIAFSLV